MRRTVKTVWMSLVFMALAAAPGGAESLGDILAKVQKKADSTRDLCCDVRMDMDIMGQKASLSGVLKMELPNKMAMEMDMKQPGTGETVKMRMVNDGHVMYQEMRTAGGTLVNKIDVEASGLNTGELSRVGDMGNFTPNPAQVLAEMQKIMELKELDDQVLADGQNAWVFEGKFKPEYYRMMRAQMEGRSDEGFDVLKSQMAGMRVYVGQRDTFMNRVEFLSSDGGTTGSMGFTNVKFNQGLPADTFKYELPEGATVNDMTEMMKAQTARVRAAMGKAEPEETRKPAGEGPPSTVLQLGVSAPAFTVTTLDGRKLDVVELRGKPLLILFWATWHKGSVERLVEVDKLKQTHKTGLQVLALSLDEADAADDVRKLLAEKGVGVPTAIGNDAIFDAYWISEVPSYVLIDAEGKVLSSEGKPKNLSELEKTLGKLFGKGGGEKNVATN